MKTPHKLFYLFMALALMQCTSPPVQHTTYSIVGSWKLIDMQFDGKAQAPEIEESLGQNETRFVYDTSGKFMMVLDTDGRGLQGGYYYDPETSILSIIYGAHTDSAFVSWVNINKMIHTTLDGKTKTVLEREKK